MDPVPDEIILHYETSDEGGRLDDGLRALERLRTQELIERHLPGSPARILDVGGATGVYAQWLADRGHDVLLIDVVPSHVEAAQRLRSDAGRIDAQVGDARALPVEDDAWTTHSCCWRFSPTRRLEAEEGAQLHPRRLR